MFPALQAQSQQALAMHACAHVCICVCVHRAHVCHVFVCTGVTVYFVGGVCICVHVCGRVGW